jgi:hypothetical protein
MDWRRRAVLLLCATAVVGSCGTNPPPTSAGGLRIFDEGGLTFVYPGAWQEFHHPVVSSFSTSIADLATVDVPEPCTSRPVAWGGIETVCVDQFGLTPNTLVLHVVATAFPDLGIVPSRPPGAIVLLVGGRPAYMERRAPDDPAVGADSVVRWTLSRPGGTHQLLHARSLDPGAGLWPSRRPPSTDDCQRAVSLAPTAPRTARRPPGDIPAR